MQIKVSENFFQENSAKIEGGAIKWSDEQPLIINNTFLNNSALYGNDIASFPLRLILNVYLRNQTKMIPEPNKNEVLKQNSSVNLKLGNISSGNEIPYILQFLVVDVYGKIVNLDSGYFVNFMWVFRFF